MRSRSRHVAELLASVLVLASFALAQSATTSLRGTITDAKGAVVAGATVTLANKDTGFNRSAKSDDQGIYQFLEVPPAKYDLAVIAQGFSTTRRENVVLQVSSPATVNLALQVQGSNVIVDVTGEAPVVNTQDATLGNNFGTRQLIDLPS
ncbi:MAG TPA: carboxypeptidase-like regulatory domain-containing protein, partial [Candidatus Acidoferrum sp.]|nr:carboxypeptidase-like regulatory domain-containing protein [Candidatus Acidoferrum sp.]